MVPAVAAKEEVIDARSFPLQVNLRVLGGLTALDQDGVSLSSIGRKALALLVYLSFSAGSRASREKLADLLWPDRSSAQSRNNLRQTVSVLRRELPGLLDAEREFIMLAPDRLSCDALRLIEVCERPQPNGSGEVADLYKGPFLDGFFSGSEVFDEWAAVVRTRLQAAAVHALTEGIRSAGADTGLQLLGHLLTIDPTREVSYQLGMELHSARWQPDQALRYYENCKAMLAREFGVVPSPETERIRKRIVESAPAVQQGTSPGHPPPATLRSQPRTVRLEDFQNLNGSADFTAFMKALADAVAIELTQVHEVVVSGSRGPVRSDTGDRDALVLRGSLLTSGHDVLVMVRLSEGWTGRELGGERFVFRNGEQFQCLPDMALCIALATRFESLHAGWQLRDLLPADRYPVRLMLLKAHCRYYELTDRSLKEAIKLSEQALDLEPRSLRASRMLSLSLSGAMIQGVLPASPERVDRAIALAREASRAMPDDVFSRCVLAWALGLDHQHEHATEELRYAIRLNPTYATLHSDLAEHLAMLGYLSEALAEIDEAIRLTGEDVVSFWRYYTVSVAQFAAGNYAAALENARRVMRDKPGLIRGALFHAASAAALGLQEEAQTAMRWIMGERPWLRIGNVAPGFMPRFVQDRHHFKLLAQLRKAGMPE